MNKNRRYIVVLLLLVVAAIFMYTQQRNSTLKKQESDFSVEDTSTVNKIFIADKRMNQITLERTPKGWMLDGDQKVNQRLVHKLLGTMHRIKVQAPVSNVSYENVVKRMAAIAIKVEVYQEVYRIDWFDKIKLFKHLKLTKVFYVGDATANNLGTYMLMEGASQPYITYIPGFRGFLTPRFSPLPDDWKSHEVFKYQLADIKSVQFNVPEKPDESFKIEVKDDAGNYRITQISTQQNIDHFDTLKVLNLLTSFADVRYETRLNNLMAKVRIDSVLNSPPRFELILVDQENDTNYVKMFRKGALPDQVAQAGYNPEVPVDNDRFYGLVNDGEDFVLLQYFVFDKLLKPLSYYEK